MLTAYFIVEVVLVIASLLMIAKYFSSFGISFEEKFCTIKYSREEGVNVLDILLKNMFIIILYYTICSYLLTLNGLVINLMQFKYVGILTLIQVFYTAIEHFSYKGITPYNRPMHTIGKFILAMNILYTALIGTAMVFQLILN
jgi:hypothetical protein